jgi:hypothetical protein
VEDSQFFSPEKVTEDAFFWGEGNHRESYCRMEYGEGKAEIFSVYVTKTLELLSKYCDINSRFQVWRKST